MSKNMEQSNTNQPIEPTAKPELRQPANLVAPTAETGKDLTQAQHQVDETIAANQPQDQVTSIEGARPIPAQNQMPSDSYVYANTSNMGGAISAAAEQYNLDPHELEALTSTIRNKKADLSGFWKMQVGYYPGMSAESLVTNIARVADLSNTDTENRKQKALLAGEKFTGNGMQQLVDSLQTPDNKIAGKEHYTKILDSIRESDHVQFDSTNLSNYYELMVKSGMSKAQAWENTMNAQDKYRASQDTRAVMGDFNNMGDPAKMQDYTENLYAKIAKEKDPETKLRLVGQWEAASKLTAQYTEAYAKDPAAFLMTKDPTFKTLIEEANKQKDFSNVIKQLDLKYNEMGVPEAERTYLTQKQAKSLSTQINTLIKEDPSKAQASILGIMMTYKQGASKAIGQLMRENKVGPEARVLIEAARTGSPALNGDVMDMIKHKMALKNDFSKTMFGSPDTSTANVLRTKLEREIYGLPGYKAMVQNLNMAGNVTGKIELAQYYADMASYYKYKNPNVSDKQVAQMVQTNLIDSVYSYDAASRVILQKRTIEGKPILYNKYSPEQATQYLTNRGFAGLGYTVSNKSHQVSDALLKNKNNVQYRVLDQFTVQPFYHDSTTGVNELILDKNSKPLKLNLSHLGQEDIIGTITARDSMRKTLKEMYHTSGAVDPKTFITTTGRLGGDPNYFQSNAYKSAVTIDQVDKTLSKSKADRPVIKELERTNLSETQIQALNKATILQQEFDAKIAEYQKLQQLHRDMTHGSAYKAAELLGPFFKDTIAGHNFSRLTKTIDQQAQRHNVYKEELKTQRDHLYRIEKDFMQNTAIFLDYKGTLPEKPFTKDIDENLYEKMWYGGY